MASPTKYVGNKNRPINSVRNLQRALNREERARRAAEAAAAQAEAA